MKLLRGNPGCSRFLYLNLLLITVVMTLIAGLLPNLALSVVAIAPQASHSPVIYPVAILKNSKNQAAAKSFVQFLFSQQAKAVYKNHGYTVLQ